MKYRSVLSLIFLASITALASFYLFDRPLNLLHAQVSDTPDASIPAQIPDVTEELDVTVSPQNPQPNDTVTVSLEAPGTNIDKADIAWSQNGKIEQGGVGDKTYTFNAGPLGTVSTITIDFTPYNGPVVEKTVTVSAESVDVLWEANTYRPPFYEGKSAYTPEGEVTFMAMPNLVDANGNTIDPTTLVYNWSINDKPDAANSGYGKNYYVFDGDILAQQTYVSVHVTTVEGDVQGDGSLLITPSGAGVLAYQNDPTYGVLFNKAMSGDFNLTSDEITLSAYPFNVSTDSRSDPNLEYTWSINSSPIDVAQSQSDLDFRNSGNNSGTSLISVGVQDTDKIRQSASYNFNILLNQKSKAPFNF
jgi:hypothetical protein